LKNFGCASHSQHVSNELRILIRLKPSETNWPQLLFSSSQKKTFFCWTQKQLMHAFNFGASEPYIT
jgi:hypothetical protein